MMVAAKVRGNLFNEEGSLTSDDLKTINWEHLNVKLFRIRDHAETFAAELADRGYVSMTVPFEENFCGNECKELIGATQIVRIQITVEEITGGKIKWRSEREKSKSTQSAEAATQNHESGKPLAPIQNHSAEA